MSVAMKRSPPVYVALRAYSLILNYCAAHLTQGSYARVEEFSVRPMCRFAKGGGGTQAGFRRSTTCGERARCDQARTPFRLGPNRKETPRADRRRFQDVLQSDGSGQT
ncbi:hypothetical protein GCM10010973_26530 [Cribrihabitans marinus]|nr:hypothetical protein GCM10010973_26530 [Cribrihabitans marinus]